MKKLTLLVALIGLSVLVNAQKKQNIYFLKKNGKEVFTKDSADFIRIIQEPDSGEVNFKLLEYYIDGKPKAIGAVSKFDPMLVYEDQLVTYDKNGIKEFLSSYKSGKFVSKKYQFFANGKIKRIVQYPDDPVASANEMPNFLMGQPSKLDYLADSLGNIMIENGNGHFKETAKNYLGEYVEEGNYVNGEKDGVWTMATKAGDYSYTEKYLKGKFLSGESVKDGQTYIYALTEEVPTYQGGIANFYKFLVSKVRYPADAMRANISGKVFLSFVIEKDGKVADIKVDRSVYPSLDEEAVRVLKLSTGWVPGKVRGVPVRVKYNIPINFALNR